MPGRTSVKTDLDQLLRDGPVVINIEALQFAENVRDQDAEVVHVEWTPPLAEIQSWQNCSTI
jgi:hypothetical protein